MKQVKCLFHGLTPKGLKVSKVINLQILKWVVLFCSISIVSCKKEDLNKSIYQLTISKGQTVAIDKEHSLMWQIKIDWEPYNFNERGKVFAYCKNLNYAGFTDWKVPTIDELRTMIVGCPSREKCRLSENCLDIRRCWTASECMCHPRKGPGEQGYYFDEEVWLNGKTYKEVVNANFWTSNVTLTDGESTGIIIVNFLAAETGSITDPANMKFVRCVRKLNP